MCIFFWWILNKMQIFSSQNICLSTPSAKKTQTSPRKWQPHISFKNRIALKIGVQLRALMEKWQVEEKSVYSLMIVCLFLSLNILTILIMKVTGNVTKWRRCCSHCRFSACNYTYSMVTCRTVFSYTTC